MRADGAGATHALCVYCREGNLRFSFGFDCDERVREAIISLPESAWRKAIRPDGKKRKHSQVAEITDLVDLSAWPEGTRLIARRTKLREGDQQSFADHDGYRLAVFITDQQGKDIAKLDLIHRGHARVEDRIREGKDCGMRNLPFRSFAHNVGERLRPRRGVNNPIGGVGHGTHLPAAFRSLLPPRAPNPGLAAMASPSPAGLAFLRARVFAADGAGVAASVRKRSRSAPVPASTLLPL